MLRQYHGLLIATLLLASSACNAEIPEGCIEGPGEMCTMKSGGYAGFSIGMTTSAAFKEACDATQNGKLSEHPVLYTDGTRKGFYKTSICQLETEALAAEKWILIEPGFRDRSIVLEFSGGALNQISLGWRGLDP